MFNNYINRNEITGSSFLDGLVTHDYNVLQRSLNQCQSQNSGSNRLASYRPMVIILFEIVL